MWKLLLLPQRKFKRCAFGLGHDKSFTESSDFSWAITRLLILIRRTRTVPAIFNFSQGHRVHKSCKPHIDDSGLTADSRVVHSFGSLPKLYYRALWLQHDHPEPLYCAYGAVAGMRREEAIATQEICHYRLSAANISTIQRFWDVRNAFPSIYSDEVEKSISHLPEEDFELFQQLLHDHVCVLDASDGPIYLHQRNGVPQGHSMATELFNRGYWVSVSKFDAFTSEHNPLLLGEHPTSKQLVNCTNKLFVDDLASLLAHRQHLPLLDTAKKSAAQLDQDLWFLRMVQNSNKAQTLLHLHGLNAHHNTRTIITCELLQGCQKEARYLGPHLQWQGHYTPERHRSIRAAQRAFYEFRAVWSKSFDLDFKLLMFRSIYIGTLFSGVIAFALSESDYKAFDSAIAFYGRKLMRGKACEKTAQPDGSIKHKSLTNRQVCEWLRIAPSKIELTIQRLHWFQTVLKAPIKHAQYLTAMFGTFPFERNVCHNLANGHPWIKQLCQDLQSLSDFDDIAWVIEVLDNYPAKLLYDDELCAEFIAFDVTILRARALGIQIPPPGYHSPQTSQSLPSQGTSQQTEFTCGQMLVSGEICTRSFPTMFQLLLHQRQTNDPNHGNIHLTSMVCTNVCPWCNSIFASKSSAIQHVRNSFFHQCCHTDRAYLPSTIVHPGTITCPICSQEYREVHEYHWHVCRDHIPPPTHIELEPSHGQRPRIGGVLHAADEATAHRRLASGGTSVTTGHHRHVVQAQLIERVGESSGSHDYDRQLSDPCRLRVLRPDLGDHPAVCRHNEAARAGRQESGREVGPRGPSAHPGVDCGHLGLYQVASGVGEGQSAASAISECPQVPGAVCGAVQRRGPSEEVAHHGEASSLRPVVQGVRQEHEAIGSQRSSQYSGRAGVAAGAVGVDEHQGRQAAPRHGAAGRSCSQGAGPPRLEGPNQLVSRNETSSHPASRTELSSHRTSAHSANPTVPQRFHDTRRQHVFSCLLSFTLAQLYERANRFNLDVSHYHTKAEVAAEIVMYIFRPRFGDG